MPQSRAELKCSKATKISQSFNLNSLFCFLFLRHFVTFKFLFLEFIVKFVCLKFINIVYILLFLFISMLGNYLCLLLTNVPGVVDSLVDPPLGNSNNFSISLFVKMV